MLHRPTAFAALLLALSGAAAAQTATTFGYQGRLDDAGLPANGSYDLEFQLFSDAGGTVLVSGAVDKIAQPVARGLFSTTLDFGAAFDGSARYLRVGVRPGSTGGPFTFLAPLQLLTAEPEAIRTRISTLLLSGGTDQSLGNFDFIGMGSSSATFIRNSFVAGANGTLANLTFTIRQAVPTLNLTAVVYVNSAPTALQVVIPNGATATFGSSSPGVQQPVLAGDLISVRFSSPGGSLTSGAGWSMELTR